MKILISETDSFLGKAIYANLSTKPELELQVLSSISVAKDVCMTFAPDVILHLEIGRTLEVNNIILCEAINAMQKKPRVIYVSSLDEYRDALFDDSEIDCVHRYFNDINLRLFDVVGNDSPISKMLTAARSNRTISTTCSMRAFCSVDDAVPWICEFIMRISEVKSGTYNIGNPNNFMSMKKIAMKVKKMLKSESGIELLTGSLSRLKRPTISKALAFYTPKYDLDYIISQMAV